jgi:hypothetical protein
MAAVSHRLFMKITAAGKHALWVVILALSAAGCTSAQMSSWRKEEARQRFMKKEISAADYTRELNEADRAATKAKP